MSAVGNNSSEGLKFGAGLFLTISFITLCVLVFFIAQDGAKTATKKFTGLNTELSQSEFVVYESSTVSGSQVLNAINKYTGVNNEFGVSVTTGKSATGVWYGRTLNTSVAAGTAGYGSVLSSGTGTVANAQDETRTDYVNPNGSFRTNIVKDENNVVRGIIFVQQ